MNTSYLNIITFILSTIFYYLALKPTLTYEKIINIQEYEKYTKNNYISLAIYLLLVIIVQFIVNSYIISNKCSGNLSQNIASAGLITLIPWLLIFGAIIIVLMIFPGFKTAFSDVIGYYYVSNQANYVISELLVNKDIQQKIDQTNVTPAEKERIQDTADAIIKICSNTSLLINQIVPTNFQKYWNILTPLMKTKYNTTNEETTKLQKQLFELVVTRDNIGEAMWYIYTGILLTSIVQMKINTTSCYISPQQMEQNYKTFLQNEEQAQAAAQQAQSTVYTTTS